MNRLKFIILGVISILPLISVASDFPWLTFKMLDSSETSVAADGLEINYADGELRLKSATVEQSFPVAQILSMRFTSSPSGVESIGMDAPEVMDYYNLSGICVGRFESVEDARKSLPSGVYVIKNEIKTVKVIF